MTPTFPPIYNSGYVAPEGMTSDQVGSIPAFKGRINQGNLDGADYMVTAWKPSSDDLRVLNDGGSIFMTAINNLPPHFLSTSFNEATNGQYEG